MSPFQLQRWALAMNSMGRPFITALVTTIYNLALLIAVALRELEMMAYITAVGPTNAMIIGFWFGERKALNEQTRSGEAKMGEDSAP